MDAYQAVLQLDPNESAAGNNLANIYTGRREFARAESLYKRAIVGGRATSQQYTNLISALYNSGKIEEAERYQTEFQQRFPAIVTGAAGRGTFLYQRGQLDSLDVLYRPMTSSDNVNARIQGYAGLANLALTRGQVSDARRYVAELRKALAQLGQPQFPISDSLQMSYIDLYYVGDTARAVRRIETTLSKINYRAMPFDNRPYTGFSEFFANVGQPQRARAILAQYDADMPDSVTRRIREPGRHDALGTIALAEGHYQDAIREFWRSDTTYDGPNGSCTICVMENVAQAWRRAGVPDSAIYYYEKYLNTPVYGRESMDSFMGASIQRTLGELYEAKGDAVNAAKHYRAFIDRWEHADAVLLPKVAEVRRKLSRLADVERK
jgi:tetratricopeptide (TPR) repeat protein